MLLNSTRKVRRSLTLVDTGLGSTVPQLASEIKSVSQHAIEPKREFSMAHGSRLLDMLKNATGKGHSYEDVEFILCGIEAHVCVLQTVQDLSQKGARIHVVRDGISSCNGKEVNIAVQVRRPLMQAMREAGADIATSESILFQLLGMPPSNARKRRSSAI